MGNTAITTPQIIFKYGVHMKLRTAHWYSLTLASQTRTMIWSTKQSQKWIFDPTASASDAKWVKSKAAGSNTRPWSWLSFSLTLPTDTLVAASTIVVRRLTEQLQNTRKHVQHKYRTICCIAVYFSYSVVLWLRYGREHEQKNWLPFTSLLPS